MADILELIGKRVRFAPNPGMPGKIVEATVIRHRSECRGRALAGTSFSRGRNQGWFDTRDDAGFERSVRPSRCQEARAGEGM